MITRSILSAWTALLLIGTASAALGQDLRGVALVIGESEYDSTALRDLDNPKNDARAMDKLLGELGFDVDRVLDKDGDALRASIEDFVDAAAEADVALVYYSGHGIEAGGENYLVPVDADISTPQAAGESVVPIDDLLDRLARTVPVTIVLLDACRTNAFPEGTTVALPGSTQVVDVATTGLGEVRGPTPMAARGAQQGLGMVIGFAAAPGQAALDGEPGGNSPYATALLKHLGASGYSFGDVMTMVSEEVYLKTDARQLPWTNSSLRRVLSFGTAAVTQDADAATIADGRRRLLLSIAALPDNRRLLVEDAARTGGVPMDALYGLLEVLGTKSPADPEALRTLLTEQTARLKSILAEQASLKTSDPEISRLAGLASEALKEGTLSLSLDYWEQAKARYGSIATALDATEAELKQRRLEGGDLLARTAATYALAGDYLRTADNYGAAFQQVARWDGDTAFDYKIHEARALETHARLTGDARAIDAALPAFREAIALAPGGDGAAAWAGAENDYGAALRLAGLIHGDAAFLAEAERAFTAALGVWTYAKYPDDWLIAKNNLAALLGETGQASGDPALLEQSSDQFRDILKVVTRERDPLTWAMTNANLGNALASLGIMIGDPAAAEEAAAVLEAALSAIDREASPDEWATAQGYLGQAYAALGGMGATDRYEGAIAAFTAALEVTTADSRPLVWVNNMNSLGLAQDKLGEASGDDSRILAAIAVFREALARVTREAQPATYGLLQGNLGNALNYYGLGQTGTAEMEQAAAAAREALAVLPDGEDYRKATLLNILGRSIAVAGIRTKDRAMILGGRDTLVTAQRTWAAVGANYDAYFKRRFDEIDAALANLN